MLKSASENEHIQVGMRISEGAVLPAAALKAMTVVGNRQGGAQPIKVKVMRSSPASPSFVFSSFLAAERESGVAAFPIPRRFAESAAAVSSLPIPLLQAFGNARRIIGLIRRDISLRAPHFCATDIIPPQRHISGKSDRTTDNALPPPDSAASVREEVVPQKKEAMTDITIIIPEILIAIFILLLTKQSFYGKIM